MIRKWQVVSDRVASKVYDIIVVRVLVASNVGPGVEYYLTR